MNKVIEDIIAENERRLAVIAEPFNPITGVGSIGERFTLRVKDCSVPSMLLPISMKKEKIVRGLIKYGSLSDYLTKGLKVTADTDNIDALFEAFVRLRCRHDFPFWAYAFVRIKPKDTSQGTGEDIPFLLNRQQRRLVSLFESQRLADAPIRVVLAKSRQWGGSTVTQIYMAWLQLVHRKGLNSLIVGHQKDSCAEVEGMFIKVINAYPTSMLYPLGETFDEKEPKFVGDHTSMNIHHIPQRNCKVKVGSAEKPDSARGGDSALVHCTEVAFWKKTEGKTPEQIVRSACGGVQPTAYTMIVYESSPNGAGNFFDREYADAKAGRSQFAAMFVPWHSIEKYSLPLSPEERLSLARWLYDNRENAAVTSSRDMPGKYYWYLWQLGATLDAIAWYRIERGKYTVDEDMFAEYPSDDIEAFTNSGARVFSAAAVQKFRSACRPPLSIGDIYADGTEGREALSNVRFIEDRQGQLFIWAHPDTEELVTNRYLVVVDIGGRGSKADYSVICVFDRYWLMEGSKPSVVAQWYGHIDMDLLAWKSAQIASYYCDALLVIESNTLETKDRERITEGNQAPFILNQIKDVYDNLYARPQSDEDIRQHAPLKYGFHTNVSTKPKIISTLVKVVREGLYTERDERCLAEYIAYERRQNGSYGAIIGKHDDLLMTRAIGLHICFHEMPLPAIIKRTSSTSHRSSRPVSAASI